MDIKMDRKVKAWVPPEKIWNVWFISIFFINMALNFGQYMSNSLLSLYAKEMGAPAEQIGMLMSMFAITALIFRFVADVIPREQFSSGMGIFACAQVVAQAVGPTVGVCLKDRFGYTTTYFIFGCIMVCAILAASTIRLAPTVRMPFSLKLQNMIAKEAVLPAAVTLLIALGFTSINAFLLVYAQERGIHGASLIFTVYAITMLFTRPVIGRLTDRYGFVKAGIPSVFATAVSLAMIGFSTNLPMLLLAAFVNAFGYGAVMPALQSLCMRAVSLERRGSASSTNYIGQDLATLIGSTTAGYVIAAAGYTPFMWIIMAVPVLLGILVIFLCRKKIYRIENNFKSGR